MKPMRQYFFNILIALDQLANTLFFGDPDETISSRLGREYPNSILRKVVDFFFGKGHCRDVADNGDSGKSILK